MKKWLVLLLVLASFDMTSQIRVIKANVGSALFGAPGIAFEHVRKKKLAWQIGGSYYIPNRRESFMYNSMLENRTMTSGKITGFSVSLEHRWYTKLARREANKPYVALFGRYYQFDMAMDFTDEQTDFHFALHSINAGVGVQVGIQYVIKDKVSIDLGLLGIGYARNYLSGEVITVGGDPNIGKLEDDISEMPLLGNRIRLKAEDDKHVFNNRYGAPLYRGGIYFGVLF
ncbi:MAG: DUF3575 domain-containing protein [Flavobacteriales bacterium]|nr:DUF3575 domain-containing protein [Flavobacteriales bacterium]